MSSLNDRERADLVAYLDGELKGEPARVIEARLSLEPAVRAEADSLRRAWDLLDFLPRPAPSPTFTDRTLEKLAPVRSGAQESASVHGRWTTGWLAAGWAAAVVAALAVGYGGGRGLVPREPGERELVRDLRVIENKRLYESVEDLDFLRSLDDGDFFGDDSAGS